MSKISAIRDHFALQPRYLKLATIACTVLGVALLLLPLVPGSHLNIGSTTLSQGEIWSTGTFIAVYSVGLVMTLLGVGLLLAKSWARPLLMVLPLPQLLPFYLVHWLLAGPDPTSQMPLTLMAAFTVLWAVCWYFYLYRHAAVLRYFADAP